MNKLSKKLNALNHGDVIVFHEDAERDFINSSFNAYSETAGAHVG